MAEIKAMYRYQLANLLSISVSTLSRWIKRSRLRDEVPHYGLIKASICKKIIAEFE